MSKKNNHMDGIVAAAFGGISVFLYVIVQAF